MEVGVKVFVEDLITGERKHTSSAYVTFVAIDAGGNRTAVPPVIAETEEEKRRFEEAGQRREYRLELKNRAGK
jgi:acyl-CoA hydrolase